MSARRRRLVQTRARERVRTIRTKQERRRDYHYGIYLSSPEGSNCGEEWGPADQSKMSFTSWMVVVSASTSPSPMSYVGHSSYKGLGSKMFEFESVVSCWDRTSQSSSYSSSSCNDLISPTTTSEADEDEKRSDDFFSPLSVSTSSPDSNEIPPLELGRRRKSSIRSHSRTMSATAWGFTAFLVPSPTKERKNVLFNGTDRVVLIPARSDYDDETKADMWWAFSDYNDFQRTAKVDFERCGHDWSQLPEDEPDMAAVDVQTRAEDEGETDVALTEILSEEEEHAALVSFLSHKPLYRPESPCHGSTHSTLPSSLDKLATGAVEVECDEVVNRDVLGEDDRLEVRGLSHSKSCPTLCIDTHPEPREAESPRPVHDEQEEEVEKETSSLLLPGELPDLLPPCDGLCHKQHFSSPRQQLFSPRRTGSPQRFFRICDTLDLASSDCGSNSNRLRVQSSRTRTGDYARSGSARRSLDDMHMSTATGATTEWGELLGDGEARGDVTTTARAPVAAR